MIFTAKMFVISFALIFNVQLSDGAKLLKNLQDKYDTVQDFTASFKQINDNSAAIGGKFYYKNKDKFRIEMGSRILISDGLSVWNYSPDSKKVIITPVDNNSNSFSINNFVFEYPKLCKVEQKESSIGKKVLSFVPKTEDLEFKEVKLVVNSNNLIDQIEMIDLMDRRFNVTLTNTSLNNNLPDKLFTFEPSEGIQIIDLR